MKESNKNWRENNPKYNKKHYQEKKDILKANSKKNREENPEYIKKWLKDNPEYMKKWAKTEKGKAVNQRGHSKMRAKGRKIINTLTVQEWQDILKEHNFKCVYCGKDLFDLFTKPTRDHIIPIDKGGENVKENVVPACRSCNSRKHNKMKFPKI
jgi:5-methylcytosine-specific restriction endonuclease McrA